MKSVPRVLVLEDEPLIAAMLAEWLTELACETVGPAHSVPRALELIGSGTLDAAILDVSLVDRDCTPVADVLQGRGVPFAFATGRRPDGFAARYAKALWLSKPYDFATLRIVLDGLLGGLPG
jgi:DNA-binding response OmpR family regulator